MGTGTMLFPADIGNTSIAAGLYDGKKLARSWRLSSTPLRTSDEYFLILSQLLGKDRSKVKKCAYVSVVPPVEAAFRDALEELAGRAPLAVTCDSPLPFRVGYRNPSEVGADRLATAAAAVERFGVPVIVVDFGTAVTIDVVSRARVYLGGAIAPGVELSARSLARGTAKLPVAALKAPKRAIGTTTQESLAAGLVLGCADMVDGLLARIFREMDGRPAVVATGGAAHIVAPHSRLLERVVPNLCLEGVRLVAGKAAR